MRGCGGLGFGRALERVSIISRRFRVESSTYGGLETLNPQSVHGGHSGNPLP